MSITPVPSDLVHDPKKVAENGKLFDEFCKLIPQESIPIEPLWPVNEVDDDEIRALLIAAEAETRSEPSLEEKHRENKEYIERGQREVVSQIASSMVDKIRQIVEKEGGLNLPLGLVVVDSDKLRSLGLVAGQGVLVGKK